MVLFVVLYMFGIEDAEGMFLNVCGFVVNNCVANMVLVDAIRACLNLM